MVAEEDMDRITEQGSVADSVCRVPIVAVSTEDGKIYLLFLLRMICVFC